MKDLQSKLDEIFHLVDINILKMNEVSMLCDQIIEYKSVLPCIKSLPPATTSCNLWQEAAELKNT